MRKRLILNDHAYSYVEALMAAALLSVFIIPVLAGFLNAAQNQRYSRDAYEASLYASNLITEAVCIPADSFEELLNNPSFAEEYATEQFLYRFYAYDYDGELVFSLNASDELPAQPVDTPLPEFLQINRHMGESLSLSGQTDIFAEDETIVYENNSGAPATLNIYTVNPGKITLDHRPGNSPVTVFISAPPPSCRLIMVEVYKEGVLMNRSAAPFIGAVL